MAAETHKHEPINFIPKTLSEIRDEYIKMNPSLKFITNMNRSQVPIPELNTPSFMACESEIIKYNQDCSNTYSKYMLYLYNTSDRLRSEFTSFITETFSKTNHAFHRLPNFRGLCFMNRCKIQEQWTDKYHTLFLEELYYSGLIHEIDTYQIEYNKQVKIYHENVEKDKLKAIEYAAKQKIEAEKSKKIQELNYLKEVEREAQKRLDDEKRERDIKKRMDELRLKNGN